MKDNARFYYGIRLLLVAFLVLGALATKAVAAGQVMFSYQGRVKVDGHPFNGTGHFKFAILDTTGNVTLWSNDGTSALGGAPTASIPLEVSDGVFNVMMGDPQASMDPISPTLFQSKTPNRLRVWFNNGVDGFQQLNPDQKLTNLTLTTIETGNEDFTIYVDGATGDDLNNGLTPQTPKKTIQSAVDSLPDRIKCNVTIDIADGIYREDVVVYGLAVDPEKKLELVGDETWTAASAGNPSVRVSGLDQDTPGAPRNRNFGLKTFQCSGIQVQGVQFDGFGVSGTHTEASIIAFYNCKFTNNAYGCFARHNASLTLENSIASENIEDGFYIGRQSSVFITDCKALNNGRAGIVANGFTTFQFLGQSSTAGNLIGVLAQHKSSLIFTGKLAVTQNTQYGLDLRQDSYTEAHNVNVTFSGNGQNSRLLWGSNHY